jgi:tRNA threonylcarbamoyladenosine biosynthesis protein TsaE
MTPRLCSRSPTETHAAGAAVGAWLQPGDLVALCGPLGAGKTHFVKGIAAGLQVPPGEPVVSPTFVLVREYAGRLPLFHVDAYRLASADELSALGLDEMRTERRGAVIVEWADRVPALLAEATAIVEIAHVDESSRTIELKAPAGERFDALRTALSRALPPEPVATSGS